MFHDIGYSIEEKSEKYADASTIEKLEQKLGIHNDFIAVSKNAELIRKYYDYRRSGNVPRIDHGIVGALLLYDALMELAKESGLYSQIKEYSSFYSKICDTIAVHNMWRATEQTKPEYESFKLTELIPEENNHHKVFYKDDSLLFLLGIVDTVDPVKYFCRDKRFSTPVQASEVLNCFHIGFENSSNYKALFFQYPSNRFMEYAKNICDTETGLSSWLGVSAGIENNTLSIVFDLISSLESDSKKVS